MRKFNQMTEVQMSKRSGGSIMAVVVTIITALAGVGTGAGLSAANSK